MWIVGIDTAYYPEIATYETYEEAKEYYDSLTSGEYEKLYLAEVKEVK